MTAETRGIEIVPAVIATTVEEFRRKKGRVDGLTDWLHVDFVDGEFAAEATVTPEEVEPHSFQSRLEIHLMVTRPLEWISRLAPLRPGRVFVPVETATAIPELAERVHGLGAGVGLAVSPDTPLTRLQHLLDACDRVLVLAVDPGRQGQRFRPETVERVRAIRAAAIELPIEVDGGVTLDVAPRLVVAGATGLAVGSYLQDADEPAAAIEDLARAARPSAPAGETI